MFEQNCKLTWYCDANIIHKMWSRIQSQFRFTITSEVKHRHEHYMEGKFVSFWVDLNTMRSSLNIVRSNKSRKWRKIVLEWNDGIEILLLATYQRISSHLMQDALDRFRVENFAKANKVQTENTSSIPALDCLQHPMFSMLPKDSKIMFRTAAGNGYGNFGENKVSTSITPLQKDDPNALWENEKRVKRRNNNDDLPQKGCSPQSSPMDMMQAPPIYIIGGSKKIEDMCFWER